MHRVWHRCVTAYEASAIVTSAISSTLVLAEYRGMPGGQFAAYLIFVLVTLCGLLLLSAWPTALLGDGERVLFDPEVELPKWWPIPHLRIPRDGEGQAAGAAATPKGKTEHTSLLEKVSKDAEGDGRPWGWWAGGGGTSEPTPPVPPPAERAPP